MSNKGLLKETYEVPVFDKVLLDQIHLVLDSGNDVIIRRDPDSNHLQVESLPFKEGNLSYRDFKFIDEHLDPENPVIIGVSGDEEVYGNLILQSMDGFKDEVNDIRKNAESLLEKIKDIADNYYCGN